MKRSISGVRMGMLAVLLTGAATGLIIAAAPSVPVDATRSEAGPSPAESLDVANALSNAFRNVSKQVLPAVVAIENRPAASPPRSMQSAKPQRNPFEGTPFEDMFPNGLHGNGNPLQPGNPNSGRSRSGIGSGVIIDSAGIVLTNNHVVEGGGTVIVKTQDGREFIATEVLTDPQTDIAVVKFDGNSSLVAAQIGNSDAMEVGDWVVALGQPFGLESTVTAGIVSAKNRGIGITDRESFIQTDAAINPGNSGGPLVNLRGEVIGINTAISSSSGGNNGVGFAVPSNLAHWVSDQLLANGHVVRSYLGVGIQPVNYELSTQLGVAPKSGVAVTSVYPNTPAAKTGLEMGDVIVKFAGIAVTTPQELQLAVESSPLGKSLPINVVRDGKSIKLMYQPEAAPNGSASKTPVSKAEELQLKPMGLEIGSLSNDVAQQLGLDNQSGVVITGVQRDSAAAQAGLEAGMVIVQVNRQNVTNPAEFGTAIDRDSDDSVLLLVRAENGSRFIVVSKR